MKTFLAQNQFISNSDVHAPETSGSAAVCVQPPLPTAAEQVSFVSMDLITEQAETAAIDSYQEPMAADHIPEIFHWVRKLLKDDRRFVLDEGAFMAAIDEEPLFLRNTA
jgi:hypothetical protein